MVIRDRPMSAALARNLRVDQRGSEGVDSDPSHRGRTHRAAPCRGVAQFTPNLHGSYLARIAGQFKTTVIGVEPDVSLGTGMRNRRPSLATPYGWKLPAFVRPVRKSGCGTVAVNTFVVSIPAAINVPSGVKKKSSLPSPRHRGARPPSRETGNCPVLHRKRADIHLAAARRVRLVGDPAAVRRERAARFVMRSLQKDRLRARSREL